MRRKELTGRLRHISRWLRESGGNTSRVFKDLIDERKALHLNGSATAGAPDGRGTFGRRLASITIPAFVWNPGHHLMRDQPLPVVAQGSSGGADQEDTDKAILSTYCAINTENIIFSLSIVGLALDGITKICPKGKPDSDPIDCGAYVSAMLSEAAWAASAASTVPETCGLTELEAADCVADSTLFVGNAFEFSTDVLAAKINCFDGEQAHVNLNRRLNAQAPMAFTVLGDADESEPGGAAPLAPHGTKPMPSMHASPLEALGLIGREGQHAADAQAGSEMPMMQASPSPQGPTAPEPPVTNFPRGFDVAVCYFTAENTASTVADAVLSVNTATKACPKFEREGLVEDQEACAAEIANFLSDFGTVVANAAFLATVCPTELPPSTVPCVGDLADAVVTLSNWAVWGASFGPDCLDMHKEDHDHDHAEDGHRK